jgi:hypothetical protein
VLAIVGHSATPGGEFVAQLSTASGERVWHKSGHLLDHIIGWSEAALSDAYGDEDKAERSDVFIIGGTQEPTLGPPIIWSDVPMALHFYAPADAEQFHAERYSSGVRIHLVTGGALTVVFWFGVLHVTETGDVAPGFGATARDV